MTDTTGARSATRRRTDRRGMMKKYLVVVFLPFFLLCQMVWAGDYKNSAHGDLNNGVFRTATDTLGYARGNCAHCHEMHASIEGGEPAPDSGAPAPFTVFAFNTSVNTGPYQESDNFCFYCHNSSGSAQQVVNDDYSRTFGCDTFGGPTSIFSAFNQTSYHNLCDIYDLAKDKFSWFKEYSNPCSACHNPHLAKRNCSDPDNPLLSSISKPSDHFSLWGTTELMSAYSYEAPYCSGTGNREPGGTGTHNGLTTPDYVGFCTDCHNTSNTISSATLFGDLEKINWTSSGDKHGRRYRDSSNSTNVDFVEPYLTASATNSNFVLSCLDCHEPHGAPNIMLIRRRVNGGNLEGAVSSSSNTLGYLCTRCHKDDADAGTGSFNEWKFVHHNSGDAPYPGPPTQCGHCHGGGEGMGNPPIRCLNCHFHNGNDNWLNSVGELPTGRITF